MRDEYPICCPKCGDMVALFQVIRKTSDDPRLGSAPVVEEWFVWKTDDDDEDHWTGAPAGGRAADRALWEAIQEHKCQDNEEEDEDDNLS